MHEFETFVYLDMQKTGSTFIVRLLRQFSGQQELCSKMHEPVGKFYDPSKFYFSSIRDPLNSTFLCIHSAAKAGAGFSTG